MKLGPEFAGLGIAALFNPHAARMIRDAAELDLLSVQLAQVYGIAPELAKDRALAYCKTSPHPILFAIYDCFREDNEAAQYMRGEIKD